MSLGSFHLLLSSLISFNRNLKFFSYRSFTCFVRTPRHIILFVTIVKGAVSLISLSVLCTEKDTDLFAIPLSTIACVEYEEEDDILFILFKKSRHLHSFNINLKIHTIYIIKEEHNCIFEFFLNTYNRIRIIFIGYKLKRKTAKYIKRLILNNNSKTDS